MPDNHHPGFRGFLSSSRIPPHLFDRFVRLALFLQPYLLIIKPLLGYRIGESRSSSQSQRRAKGYLRHAGDDIEIKGALINGPAYASGQKNALRFRPGAIGIDMEMSGTLAAAAEKGPPRHPSSTERAAQSTFREKIAMMFLVHCLSPMRVQLALQSPTL